MQQKDTIIDINYKKKIMWRKEDDSERRKGKQVYFDIGS